MWGRTAGLPCVPAARLSSVNPPRAPQRGFWFPLGQRVPEASAQQAALPARSGTRSSSSLPPRPAGLSGRLQPPPQHPHPLGYSCFDTARTRPSRGEAVEATPRGSSLRPFPGPAPPRPFPGAARSRPPARAPQHAPGRTHVPGGRRGGAPPPASGRSGAGPAAAGPRTVGSGSARGRGRQHRDVAPPRGRHSSAGPRSSRGRGRPARAEPSPSLPFPSPFPPAPPPPAFVAAAAEALRAGGSGRCWAVLAGPPGPSRSVPAARGPPQAETRPVAALGRGGGEGRSFPVPPRGCSGGSGRPRCARGPSGEQKGGSPALPRGGLGCAAGGTQRGLGAPTRP